MSSFGTVGSLFSFFLKKCRKYCPKQICVCFYKIYPWRYIHWITWWGRKFNWWPPGSIRRWSIWGFFPTLPPPPARKADKQRESRGCRAGGEGGVWQRWMRCVLLRRPRGASLIKAQWGWRPRGSLQWGLSCRRGKEPAYVREDKNDTQPL